MREKTSERGVLSPGDLFSLKGRKALITGGSGGIGRVLAVALGSAGADVCVHGRNDERLRAAAAEIGASGVHVAEIQGDLSDVSMCKSVVHEADETLGGLDILINCAGMNRRKPIAEVTEDDYDAIMSTNLKSIYFTSREAYLIMQQRGGGKVVHIGSINSFYSLDTVSVYGASKGGVAQLTKVMAVEWAEDNVQVNCITPGFMLTSLSASLWKDDRTANWFRSRIPIRRPGNPDELVGTLFLLVSGASSYITGQNIVIDGGFLAGGSWIRDSAVPGS